MKLIYFEEDNFGDALNPMIFNKLLPGMMDDDTSTQFVGIGSLIGLPVMDIPGKKIIFSTGYGQYGFPQQLSSEDEVVCVRGPLTAKVMGLDDSYAITDGAALLKTFSYQHKPKKHPFSFIPHWESEDRIAWKSLCKETGIHYISPAKSPESVIDELLQTEVLITEAMHGAIVADTLRVPWIPIKSYHNIKEFKWMEWAMTVNLPYKPLDVPPLFESSLHGAYAIADASTRDSFTLSNRLINRAAGSFVAAYHRGFRKSKVVRRLNEIKEAAPFLSDETHLNEKVDMLLEKIEYVKQKYGR